MRTELPLQPMSRYLRLALTALPLLFCGIALDARGNSAEDAHSSSPTAQITPDLALRKLLEGNQRILKEKPVDHHQTTSTRHELAQGQHPFAAVLACADSRVPVELVFDQGFGDLFTVRVAGNVATTDTEASLEYAVVHLNVPLILVLGHQKCGAVTAAISDDGSRDKEPPHIQELIRCIDPAVKTVPRNAPASERIQRAIQCNVEYQVRLLEEDSALAPAIQSGKLKVVGGIYDIESGAVRFLGPWPESILQPSPR